MGSKKQKIILLVAKLMSKCLKIDISLVNLKQLDYNVIDNDHKFSHTNYCETFKREQPNNTSELVDGKIPQLKVSTNRIVDVQVNKDITNIQDKIY